MNTISNNDKEKNATLEYLTNPVYYNSVKKTTDKINNKNNKEDIKFYRKRITALTKEMLKGIFPNETLKKIYENYTHSLITHFKMIDTKDIIQEEYSLLNVNNENNENNENTIKQIKEFNTIQQANEHIMKKPIINSPTLDNYVIKMENKDKDNEHEMPSKKKIDLSCPTLKTKGVVKKKKNKSKKEKGINDNREKLEKEEDEIFLIQ